MVESGARVLCDLSARVTLTGLGPRLLPLAPVAGFSGITGRPRNAPGRDMTVAWTCRLDSGAIVGTVQLLALVATGRLAPANRVRSAASHGLWPMMPAPVASETGILIVPSMPAGWLALVVDVTGGPGAGDVLAFELAAWDWPDSQTQWTPTGGR